LPQASFVISLEGGGVPLQKLELTHLHRTADPSLLAVLLATRHLALDQNGKDSLAAIRTAILETAPVMESLSNIEGVLEEFGTEASSTLFLFRTRFEALRLSDQLSTAAVTHRLRFGGLPRTVSPWIAWVFNDIGKAAVTEPEFSRAFGRCFAHNPVLTDGSSVDAAWRVASTFPGWA